MAKDTIRDRVWKTALRFGSGTVEHDTPQVFDSHIPDGFTKQELQKAVDASDRVVHDVLKTMTDYGFLSEESQRVYVRQGDSYAIHAATVYSDASESPAGEAGQDDDESPVNETKSNEFQTVSKETVIEPAIKTHDIDQLPFDEGTGSMQFRDLPNVSKKRRFNLIADGVKSFNDLYVASVDELSQVDGIGTKTARKIKIYIAEMIRKKRDVSFEQIASEPESHIAEEYNLDEKAAKAFHDHALAKTKHTQNPAET